jgi:diguanylate cyclase (GGDEF)-like protein
LGGTVDNYLFSRRLYLYPAVLGIWLVFCTFGLTIADPTYIFLALALLIFTTTLALLNLFRFSGWLAALFSAVCYASVYIFSQGFNPQTYFTIGVFIIGLIGSVFLGSQTVSQVLAVSRQLERDQKLIDSLEIYDSQTKVINWTFAEQNLKNEIARSQRYNRDICLVLLQITNIKELEKDRSVEEVKNIQSQLANILVEALRTVDIPFYSGKLGVILPETKPVGALIAVNRVVDTTIKRLRLPLSLGISHFPADAVTEEELVQAAESALQVSLSTDQSIVFYSHIRSAVKEGTSSVGAIEAPLPGNTLDTQPTSSLLGNIEPVTPLENSQTDQSGSTIERLKAMSLSSKDEFFLGILGIQKIVQIDSIAKMIREHPSVDSVRLIEYRNGTVLLGIKLHEIENNEVFKILQNLPLKTVSSGDQWVAMRFGE